ncbi:MAG: hypothetical protein JWM36_702 [Hyphomicrobiales bacterium]|nr:hypothetical protein [Hyphomicrobiales bacterium]
MTNRRAIGLESIAALQPGEVIWDARVIGFGARRQRGPNVSYVIAYRTREGRQRWFTIGRHGSPWTPSAARAEAQRILGEVAAGKDPAGGKSTTREAATVAEFCDIYLKDAESGRLLTKDGVPKKPSTLATDKGRIEHHIKPLLGRLKVSAVTREDVEQFLHSVAEGETAARVKSARGLAQVTGGRGTASRTLGLLGAIFTYAVRKKLRADNPVRGVVRFADKRRERRLSEDEYEALGTALRKAEGRIWPAALAATRMLLFTGWRSGEVIGLQWDEVDLARRSAILSDTKTGRSLRPLSKAASSTVTDMSRASKFVFPATRGSGPMSGFPSLFRKVCLLGGLPADVTPHVLRHSFASLAADLGFSELTIAALIGHAGQSITSRYVHSADAVLLGAADAIATQISTLVGDHEIEG